jgi:hypothetical protein
MKTDDLSKVKDVLQDLNRRFSDEEQKGQEAVPFFERYLSDKLIFRRVSGQTIGKHGPNGFLENLKKGTPFVSRRSEDIAIELVGDRALVTLIVVGTRGDGGLDRFRNIRLFTRSEDCWILEFWYNFKLQDM